MPKFFFNGLKVTKVESNAGWTKVPGGKITELLVEYDEESRRVRRTREKGARIIEAEPLWVDVLHDKRLGFGGYISKKSIAKMKAHFAPLCPVELRGCEHHGDGELVATGNAISTLALFPNLEVPLMLRGDEIILDFPVPGDGTEPGTRLAGRPGDLHGRRSSRLLPRRLDGRGDRGPRPRGPCSPRRRTKDVVIAGDFEFDLDFLHPATVAVSYSLEKDDFSAKATLGVQKGALPGVKAGRVEVTATRETFAVSGGLDLAGPLEGSQIAVDYNRETGLTIAGKDLPLPLEKLPGVSEAKVTVIVRRRADTGEWEVSGGGKAAFDKGGAKGSLDILFDGEAVDLTGRVDLAKGPASAGSRSASATARWTTRASRSPVRRQSRSPPGARARRRSSSAST